MAMSLRLMTVGRTIETASPSIVIFLPGEGASRIEALLEQPFLRSLYRPNDGITPSFDVVVVGQAPRKRLCKDIRVTWDTSLSKERDMTTYCGSRICLRTTQGASAMATLGGIVKLTYGPRDFKLVGMTAGHVLEDLFDLEEAESLYGHTIEDDEVKSDPIGFNYSRTVGRMLSPTPSTDNNNTSTPPNHNHNEPPTPTCDWALFTIDPPLRIRPNLLRRAGGIPTHHHHHHDAAAAAARTSPTSSGMINGRSMTTAPPGSFPSLEPIEAALLSGSAGAGPAGDGTMLGVLSHVPGGIMLDPAHGFVEAYLMVLDEGQAVGDGDSGAWVVNPVSMEVFGHVVATDVTGDVYVVPMYRSLEEMRGRLGVEAVDLPGTADLLDAALRAEAGVGAGGVGVGVGGGVGLKGGVMMGDCGPSERRASEVFLLSDGWKLSDLKRSSLYHDADSGYGSTGSTGWTLGGSTPFDVTDEGDFGHFGRSEEAARLFS